MKKALIAELIGTYFLVFMGTGAIIVDHITGSLTHVGVSLVFGLVIMVMIYAFGHVSNAHFNPAVTVSFLIVGDISFKHAVQYIIVQLLGAIGASCTLLLLFGNVSMLGTTLPANSCQQAFGLEFILTFFLIIVIMYSAYNQQANSSFAGLAIGGTIGLEAMFAGPICGASMNPARSIGPALVSGNSQFLWIYVFSTTLGAAAAALIYRVLYKCESNTLDIEA